MFEESEIAFIMLNLNLGSGIPSYYPSGSNLSKATPIGKIPYFKTSEQSEDFGETTVYYSLNHVAEALGLASYEMTALRKFNQKFEVIEELCNGVELNLDVRGEGEVIGLRKFSELCSTSILFTITCRWHTI